MRLSRAVPGLVALTLSLAGCGERPPPGAPPSHPGAAPLSAGGAEENVAGPRRAVTADSHGCGAAELVHRHDLNSKAATFTATPCAKAGASDYSGAIKIETLPEGVHIIIDATDDEVNLGVLGADVRTRDAVIVYPRGRGSKAVEVPLLKTKTGYVGDQVVLWEDLDNLTDEGTKLDITVYDHDPSSNQPSEEMHFSVAVSTGTSCQKAEDENVQTIDMGGKSAAKADLTNAQLIAPVRTNAWIASCGLGDGSHADICVAIKRGKPVGVSVSIAPPNNRVATCIDRATRNLRWPESQNLDVIHQRF